MRTRPPAHRVSLRAFTLVELLVVIGIIALLIAILMPTLSKARAQGQWAACLSNMRQIGQAMLFYANENKNFLPRPSSGSVGALPDDVIYWQLKPSPPRNVNDSALAKFLNLQNDRLKEIWRCPTDADAPIRKQIDPGRESAYGGYQYSYSMNDYLMAWVTPPNGPLPRWAGGTGTSLESNIDRAKTSLRPKLTHVVKPAAKAWLGEERLPNDCRWDAANFENDRITDRHSKMGNILFFDNHVERLYPKEAQQKIWFNPFGDDWQR